MRAVKWALLALLLIPGCVQIDQNPKWNPRALPDWTYDAPWYYRPTEELQVGETIGEGIPIYYSGSESVFVVHPGNCQVSGTPRVGLWCSTDEGRNWEKIGYFGVGQTHFLLEAETDGPHWIRFVGPGQGVMEAPPGTPHRIYVVDRQPPEVTVTVTPSPYTDDEKKVSHIHEVGETVRVSWNVRDANMLEGSIKLGMGLAQFPNNLVFMEIPQPLEPVGSLRVKIPQQAASRGGVRFRIVGSDKAGNVGMGLTDVLHVRPKAEFTEPSELVPRRLPTSRLETEPGKAVQPVTQPVQKAVRTLVSVPSRKPVSPHPGRVPNL